MDFDAPWCPACDKLIAPKNVVPPPPPPPSPHRRPKQHVARKHGLVAGTGRVRPNGTLKTSPPLPPVITKSKSPVAQSQTPLYCSDKCHMADINAHRSAAPIDPARESPDSSSQTPALPKHSGSIAKLAKILNFPPLPPPPPTYEEPEADLDGFATEYNSGIMMAGRLLDSFRTPGRKPQNCKYSSPQERKQIPGWNDGSNAWRSVLYSTASHKPSEVERYKDQPSAYTTCNPSYSKSPRPKSTPSPLLPPPPPAPSSDEMLARYNEPFSRRSESRMSLYGPPPTSPVSTSPTRERTLLPKGAEGKLLVRDVKLKPHSGSSASLSSGWSGPTSASSRRSARSPLSLTSDSSEDPFPGKRPVFETRSWSYDNVDTYPAMEIPVKKVKKIEVQIIDGVPTEVEVEVVEKPKCLFLFAPTTRLSSR